jgi:hypothetical protein
MQSKLNNDNFNSNYYKLINKLDKEQLLLQNKEIINALILENHHKKDKSYITTKELDFIREYENNLIKLCEECPPNLLKKLIEETSTLDEKLAEEDEVSQRNHSK